MIGTIITVAAGALFQLLLVVFFAGQMKNRVDALEQRVTSSEDDIERWREEQVKLASIETKVDSVQQEVTRVRDRLDRFLDGPARVPKAAQ